MEKTNSKTHKMNHLAKTIKTIIFIFGGLFLVMGFQNIIGKAACTATADFDLSSEFRV
jgi:hypothetical protein